MTRSPWRAWSALALVVAAQAAVSSWWMWLHGFLTRPPTSDAAWYRLDALALLSGFKDGWLGFLAAVLGHDRPHPPTMPAIAALIAHLRGQTNAIETIDGFLTTLFFGAVFTVGAYRLARAFLDRGPSVWAASVAACIPVIVVNQRAFYPQMPMSAVSVWAVAELVRCKGFTDRGATLRFGAFAGAATMVKMLAPLTFGGGALFALWGCLTCKQPGMRRRGLTNLAMSIVVAILVMAPWYGRHWRSTLAYADEVTSQQGQALFSRGIPIESIERWVYYPFAILNNGLTPPVCLLLLVAGWWAWKRTRGQRAADATTARYAGVLLLVNVIVGILVTTYGQVAGEAFYVQAYLPAAAVLLVAWATDPDTGTLGRKAILVAASAWMLGLGLRSHRVDLVNDAWTWPSAEWRAVDLRRNHVRIELIPRIDYMNGWFAVAADANDAPEGEYWPNEDWATLVRSRTRHDRPKMSSVIDPKWVAYEHPYLNHPTFLYEAVRKGWSPEWVRTEKLYAITSIPDLMASIRTLDYLIVDHRGDLTPDATRELLQAGGIGAEFLRTDHVTKGSVLSLVEIRRPWDLGRYVAEWPSARTPSVALDAKFGYAFHVVGANFDATPEGTPVVHVWMKSDVLWKAVAIGPIAPTEAVLRAEDRDGRWLASCAVRADPLGLPSQASGSEYMSLMFDRFSIPKGSRAERFTLVFRPKGAKDDEKALPVTGGGVKRGAGIGIEP